MTKATQNKLTDEEKALLRLWASATPVQRLAWLEEVQQIALKSGALGVLDSSVGLISSFLIP